MPLAVTTSPLALSQVEGGEKNASAARAKTPLVLSVG